MGYPRVSGGCRDPSSIQESPFLMDCGEEESRGSLDALLLEGDNEGATGLENINQATVSQGGSGEQ